MKSLKPSKCPITGETDSQLVFAYHAPPHGEVGFSRPEGEPYHREVWRFSPSGHFVSTHEMKVSTGYDGDYVEATYQNAAAMAATYERIIALPAEKSDNKARFRAVKEFSDSLFGKDFRPSLLDVGAGLGVFPHAVRQAGWDCTAIDPDARCIQHYLDKVGVAGICGDFMTLEASGQYDIVTLNKVLEHVEDPVAMLQRVHPWLKPGGFVYIEVPDGEVASRLGPDREEFFVEHHHVFSLASTAVLASRAGFQVHTLTRLKEPSTKHTLRAYLTTK